MKNNDRWMHALILIPLISVVILGGCYFFLYSLLSHTTVGPTNSVGLIAVVTSLLIPGVVSKIFKVKQFQVVMVWIGFVLAAFVLNKTGEGNRSDAMIIHFLGFQMAATAITTMFVSYQLMKQK